VDNLQDVVYGICALDGCGYSGGVWLLREPCEPEAVAAQMVQKREMILSRSRARERNDMLVQMSNALKQRTHEFEIALLVAGVHTDLIFSMKAPFPEHPENDKLP
jgi:hypothetical protein